MNVNIKKIANGWLLNRHDCNAQAQWFEPTYWQQQNKVWGQSHGRNVTWFVGEENSPMVLRHYCRGGLIGKLVHDSYLFTGLKSSRAYRECQLLLQLEQLALPACRVVAAQVVRTGLSYRADLLMKMVDGAQDLVAILSKNPLPAKQWQQIGATIALFHQHKIYHADLNAHNILLDGDNNPWLIDFDRGEIREQKGAWCQQNLQRLLRSFNKEKNKLAQFYFSEDDWQLLLQGYNSAD